MYNASPRYPKHDYIVAQPLQNQLATFVKGNWFLRGVPDNCGNLLDHEMITVTLS